MIEFQRSAVIDVIKSVFLGLTNNRSNRVCVSQTIFRKRLRWSFLYEYRQLKVRRFDIYFRYIDQYVYIVAGVLAQAEKLVAKCVLPVNLHSAGEITSAIGLGKRILSDRYIKLETTKEEI